MRIRTHGTLSPLFLAALAASAACQQKGGGSEQAAAAHTRDGALARVGGFFAPKAAKDYAALPLADNRKMTIDEFANSPLKLDPQALVAEKASVTLAPDGENILIVQPDGERPSPTYSVTKQGEYYEWSAYTVQQLDLIVVTSMFLRHKLGTLPDPTGDSMFIIRYPTTAAGNIEPVLMPAKHDVTTSDGRLLYRVGNVLFDSASNNPVIKFSELGNGVWRLAGPYRDDDLCNGSVFWSADQKVFYSLTKGASAALQWTAEGDDSLSAVGPVALADDKIPALVKASLKDCKSIADVLSTETIPTVSPVTLDAQVIPLYDYEEAGSSGRKGFVDPATSGAGLSLSDEKFLTADEAFNRSFEYPDDAAPAREGLGLADPKIARPFVNGTNYAPGNLVQMNDGRVHQILATNNSRGWLGSYKTYSTRTPNSDADGQRGRINYTVDSNGDVTDKQHINTYAAELAQNAQAANDKRRTDLQQIAEGQRINNAQRTNAEKVSGDVDSALKLVALTGTNAVADYAGSKAGPVFQGTKKVDGVKVATTFAERAPLALGIAGAGTFNAAVNKAAADYQAGALTPEKEAKYSFSQGLVSGGSWLVNAASPAAGPYGSVLTGAGGVLKEGGKILDDTSKGRVVTADVGTARSVIAGLTSGGQTLAFAKGGANGQNYARLVSGAGDLLKAGTDMAKGGYFSPTAIAGTLLETAAGLLPVEKAHPVLGRVLKGEIQTAAKQLNAAGQEIESIVRSKSLSGQLDNAIDTVNNQRAQEGAMEILARDPVNPFKGLVAGGDGVPETVKQGLERQKAREGLPEPAPGRPAETAQVPGETKPGETKPGETKPGETKPGELGSEVKPSELGADPKPVEPDPNKPVEEQKPTEQRRPP